MKPVYRLFAGAAAIAVAAAIVSMGSAKADSEQRDALLGSWRLVPEKSTFALGSSPFHRLTLKFSATGGGVKEDAQGTDSDGRSINAEYTIIADGKYYPVTGDADFDSSSYTRVNDRTTVYVRRKFGMSVVAGSRMLSRDGKTLSFREETVDSDGRETGSALLVFEKVSSAPGT